MRKVCKLLRGQSTELLAESAELFAPSADLITRSGVLIQKVRTSVHELYLRRIAAQQGDMGDNPYLLLKGKRWVSDLLKSAIHAGAADFGNVQLFDTTCQSLRIAAQHGFRSEFLGYFEQVHVEDACVCGKALERKNRVAVPNVSSDGMFGNEEVRSVLLRADVEAVQSTPLFTPLGAFVGMLSTHYKEPNTFSNSIFTRLDRVIDNFIGNLAANPMLSS